MFIVLKENCESYAGDGLLWMSNWNAMDLGYGSAEMDHRRVGMLMKQLCRSWSSEQWQCRRAEAARQKSRIHCWTR